MSDNAAMDDLPVRASDAELDALVARRRAERGDRGAASSRSGDRLEALQVAAAPLHLAMQAAEVDD